MVKYGKMWTQVESCPLTDNSWRVVSVGEDQIWMDEAAGCVFLREGKFNPKWFKFAI